MGAGTETLKRTPLHDRHVAAGARLVPFAGWEMPVQYEGIRAEHMAVRERVGVFDVSHMGEVETSGPGAEALLQRLLSNDVAKIAERGAQYSVLCNAHGGVLDDLFTYRLGPDRFLTVTYASNHESDLAWFERHAGGHDATVRDRIADYAMLAVQGPEARALVEAGATPAGLGARDTLRIEACFHLYGNDLTEDRNPIEAGLGWCCKEETGFIGSKAIREARENGTEERLVPFAITGQGIARQGNPVVGGGVVTSGTASPVLGYGVGMAYLPAERTQPGTAFEIDVRGKIRSAEVRTKPLIPEER